MDLLSPVGTTAGKPTKTKWQSAYELPADTSRFHAVFLRDLAGYDHLSVAVRTSTLPPEDVEEHDALLSTVPAKVRCLCQHMRVVFVSTGTLFLSAHVRCLCEHMHVVFVRTCALSWVRRLCQTTDSGSSMTLHVCPITLTVGANPLLSQSQNQS